MSIISRLTTWTIGQVLKAADLNGEFSNITNLLNNLDGATTAWTNVKTTTLTTTGTLVSPSLTAWTTFTPSISAGFGTTSNPSGFYKRVGDTMHVRCSFKMGTVGATVASIAVPVSAVIDYAKISTNGEMVGSWMHSHTETMFSNNDGGVVFVDGSDTVTFFFAQSGTSTTLFAKMNANVMHNSDYFYFNAEIPISTWTF